MIWFIVGLVGGKFITGSWIAGVVVGLLCSVFLGTDDPEDPSPRGRR